VAIWLFILAALVLAMVMVGGATRLTDSGLSITQWKPVAGALPPLTAEAWQGEFARYKEIPQYKLLNRGMSLDQFKAIYWWEWSHRLLGRLLGVAFLVPFVWFAFRREIPKRLIWRCALLFLLGGLQGLVGWWMVASGLADRVSVAPERLAVHLGLAFLLLGALVWTGMDAWSGAPRQTLPSPWVGGGFALAGLIYLQILLGALVAGNDAGLVYNDWPLMNGAFFPKDYAGQGQGLWSVIAHSQAAVQLHHRLIAYVLMVAVTAFVAGAARSPYLPAQAKGLAGGIFAAVVVQVGLGIATLMEVVPLPLAMLHQAVAAIVFSLAVAFTWRAARV
jgi:cytochrome c oxidase assembly protein subunit 15